VRRDAPIFSLVLSKSRDWRHHDCSGAKPLFMDCSRGGCPDLGGTSIRTIRRSSPSNFQSRSFLLGGRRGLARDQSMAPLSWDSCVVSRALDTAPINASIRLLEAVECRDGCDLAVATWTRWDVQVGVTAQRSAKYSMAARRCAPAAGVSTSTATRAVDRGGLPPRFRRRN
jgi:hypothetical protein